MTVILRSSEGYVLCHKTFLSHMCQDFKKEDKILDLMPHEHMFLVNTPYVKDAEACKASQDNPSDSRTLKRKRSHCSEESKSVQNITTEKIENVKRIFRELITEAKHNGFFRNIVSDEDKLDNNMMARILSQNLYSKSQIWIKAPFNGGNLSNENVIKKVGSEYFLFPKDCRFYCRDVFELKDYVDELGSFDFIVVDPPWWNKYIRRKRAKCSSEGYQMIHNENLKELPFKHLLSPQGILVVWCTNADSHLNELRDVLFPAWNIKLIARWTWLKVTRSGDPVCSFSLPPGKQPFEQLVIGINSNNCSSVALPEDGVLFTSVPSSIHSHKPPLSDLFRPYLPEKPRCLEVFARYLLPHWTSWGLEVIKLMHESLYTTVPSSSDEANV